VREDVRRIEVKVIDDILVGEWGEREQIVNGRPFERARVRGWLPVERRAGETGRDDSSGGGEANGDQYLEEQSFLVEAGELPGEVVPELHESIDLAIVAFQRLLEIARWMHVHAHGEILRDEHLDRTLELGEMIAADDTRGIRVHHRRRIHAEANVAEAEPLDERDIFNRGVAEQMFAGVSLRAEDLRKPVTEVDPAFQLGEADIGNGLGTRVRGHAHDSHPGTKRDAKQSHASKPDVAPNRYHLRNIRPPKDL
jgi:hypothetical protein